MDLMQNIGFWAGGLAVVIGVICFISTAFERSPGWGWAVVLSGGILWPVHLMRAWNEAFLWLVCMLAGFYLLYLCGVFGF